MAATEYYGVVQQIYVAYFGRPADPVGLANFATQLDAAGAPKTLAGVEQAYASNSTIKTLIDQFGTSSESATLYAGASTAAFVNAIYTNVLNRVADTEGLLYWASAIDRGVLSRGKAALSIMAGAVANTSAQGLIDAAVVTNKITVATNFTTGLNTTAEILSYAGDTAAASARALLLQVNNTTDTVAFQATVDSTITSIGNILTPGTTYTLTNSIDTIAGGSGNDTINAALTAAGADTFTSLDSINGGAGTDTLNLVSAGGALTSATGATVTGVEIANVTSAAAITAADVSGWTGLTTLNVASGGAISGVKASATTDINVANGIAGVSVDGGHNVTISNSTAGAVSVGATTAAAGNVTATNSYINAAGVTGTVGIKGAGVLTATASKGAITFTNGTSINATAANAIAAATVAADAAAKTAADNAYTAATTGNGGNGTDASGVALTALQTAQTGFTTLAAALAAGGAVANYSADQTALNSIGAATTAAVTAGSITVAQKVQIDAAFIAALTANGGTALAARAAALAVVTPLQTANTTAVNAAVTSDAAHDASLLAAKTAAAAVVTADSAVAANVKEVTVTATTNTALTSATIKGNYGTATTQVGTGSAFQNAVTDGSTLSNTLTTVTLENTGHSELTGKALTNVSATGMSGDVKVVNTTAAHTENFTLSGITAGTYTDANATTVNITSNGTAANVLTGLTVNAATAINVTGAAGLTFGTLTADAAAVIDAHASSGTNKISLALGQKYIGGSGADVVTATTTGTVQAVTVDGGAGTNDTLILGNATNYGTTGAAKYLNFEVLQLAGLSADVSKFTGSTITSEKLGAGASVITGLTADQAAHVTITASNTATIGVAGATTVGQIDTVGLTIDDGQAAKNTITLTTPTLSGVEILNVTANDHLTIAAGGFANALALTNVNITGAGNINLTEDQALNVNTIFDAHAVTGTVTIDASGSSANGLKILGSATAANVLKGNATLTNTLIGGDGGDAITGGSAVDVITSGNGNNTIDGKGGADVITLGNGNNTVNSAGIAYTGNLTVTAGNGYNVITGGAGNDIITVGTGGNLINGGAGGDTITFGAHVAGVVDGLVYTAAAQTTQQAITSGTTVLSGVDVITGLHAGDTIDISALGTFTAGNTAFLTSIMTAGLNGDIALVKGNYAASTGIFTASSSGTDTLVQWDSNGTTAAGSVESIVLVGTTTTATHATAGVIALA